MYLLDILSIMLRREKHFLQSYDVYLSGQNHSCLSKNRFDRATADELFQAPTLKAKHVANETQSKITFHYPNYS